MFNKDQIDVVIYHANCVDGFGAAFSVWYYYKITNNNRDIIYKEFYHQNSSISNEQIIEKLDFCKEI